MGIFDSLVQGEESGMPTGILNQSGWRGALEGNNAMMNIGLGILANNSGNYGSAMAALGKGAQQGVQNTQTSRQARMQQAIYKMKLDDAKKALEQQQKQQEWLKTYGQPNATQDTTTQAPDTWQNAMQGQTQPNFNMERVAGQQTTTQTPIFDQNKALLSGVQNGAIDFKDYLSMTEKAKPKYSQTPQYDQEGNAFVLDDSGNVKRLDGIKEKQELMVTPSGLAINKNDSSNIGKTFNADDNNPNKPFIMVNGQIVPNKAYQDYEIRKANAGAAMTNVSYGSPVSGVDAKGNPVFFQPSKNGGAPSIVAGVSPPKVEPKAPTEGQAKAGTFYSQMTSASKELENLGKEGFDPTQTGSQLETAMASGLGNLVVSPKSQRARQAQNQWAESFLRVKTGAAATKDEVTMNVETFFPKIGDSKEQVEQKARARKQAENDVKLMAAPSFQKNIMSKDEQMPQKPKQSAITGGGWSAKKVK
jgi:hypothetical protein